MTDEVTPADELTLAIEKAVEDKVFNLDSVERIKDLRDKAKKLEHELAQKRQDLKSSMHEASRYREERDAAQDALRGWKARHAELTEREKDMTRIETRLELTEQHRKEYHGLLQGLVRNTTFKREVFSSGQVPHPSPQASSYDTVAVSSSDSVTETQE